MPSKTFYPSVFTGTLATATLPQRIISYYMNQYLSKLDAYNTATNSDDNNNALNRTSSLPCGRSCNMTEFCDTSNTQLCLPRRTWELAAFTTLADYATSSSAPAFLSSTPTDFKRQILPRALIDEDRVPLWTESFWNGFEMRSAQRQRYNSDGFLMGVAWTVTVVCGVLSYAFVKYGLQ